jgi:2'-5' RNA ligase
MTRLFVAMEIPREIREKISVLREEALTETTNLNWEPDYKIHLTIKFIGQVSDELLMPISDSLDFLRQYDRIKCKLSGFGFFFRNGIPQILWVGLKIDNILFNIVEQLNGELAKFNIPAETRRFKPHMTLLRIKKRFPDEWVTKFNSFIMPDINFTSDTILLIKSELLPESSKYTVIKKFNLK